MKRMNINHFNFTFVYALFFMCFMNHLVDAAPCDEGFQDSLEDHVENGMVQYFSDFIVHKDKSFSKDEKKILREVLKNYLRVHQGFGGSNDKIRLNMIVFEYEDMFLSGEYDFHVYLERSKIFIDQTANRFFSDRVSLIFFIHELGHLFDTVSKYKEIGPYRTLQRIKSLSKNVILDLEREAIKVEYEFLQTIPLEKRQELIQFFVEWFLKHEYLDKEFLQRDFAFSNERLEATRSKISNRYKDEKIIDSKMNELFNLLLYYHALINSDLPLDIYYDLAINLRGYKKMKDPSFSKKFFNYCDLSYITLAYFFTLFK